MKRGRLLRGMWLSGLYATAIAAIFLITISLASPRGIAFYESNRYIQNIELTLSVVAIVGFASELGNMWGVSNTRKEANNHTILALLIMVIGILFLYIGYNNINQASEITSHSDKLAKTGAQPKFVEQSNKIAEVVYRKAAVSFAFSIIFIVLGITSMQRR